MWKRKALISIRTLIIIYDGEAFISEGWGWRTGGGAGASARGVKGFRRFDINFNLEFLPFVLTADGVRCATF